MLKSHIGNVETSLLAISKIPANSGHPLHKGTPREAFIKEFLINHLSERVAIGQGEIIDANSQPNEQRNQIDIVLFKRDYPKLNFGGSISGFLAESVAAIIEVKSSLTKSELQKAIEAAQSVKKLKRNIISSFHTGYQPPGILSYVVAYDGPVSLDTVYSWIDPIHQTLGISFPILNGTADNRYKQPSPSLDGIFILGKGFVQFDNIPLSFVTDQDRAKNPNIKWMIADTSDGSLLYLFTLLTIAVSGISGSWLDPYPYLKDFRVSNPRFGP